MLKGKEVRELLLKYLENILESCDSEGFVECYIDLEEFEDVNWFSSEDSKLLEVYNYMLEFENIIKFSDGCFKDIIFKVEENEGIDVELNIVY